MTHLTENLYFMQPVLSGLPYPYIQTSCMELFACNKGRGEVCEWALDAILAVFLATHGSSYSLARVIVISVCVCGCYTYSDGVSRTGTFLTIHCQLERLKTEGVVDFLQAIKSARLHRPGLVNNTVSLVNLYSRAAA